jgi:hypothetical protein
MIKLYNLLFEEHRHGNAHGQFLNQEPNKKQELLLMLGVPEAKLPEYLNKLDKVLDLGRSEKQSINQIFAVLDGRKPMWFGSPMYFNKLGKIKTLILKSLDKLGLSYYTNKDQALLGRKENVEQIAQEIQRVVSTGRYVPDKQFHKAMGLALGYPAEDVETFIRAFR